MFCLFHLFIIVGNMAGSIHHYTLHGSLHDHYMDVEIYICSYQAIGDLAMVLTNFNYILSHILQLLINLGACMT